MLSKPIGLLSTAILVGLAVSAPAAGGGHGGFGTHGGGSFGGSFGGSRGGFSSGGHWGGHFSGRDHFGGRSHYGRDRFDDDDFFFVGDPFLFDYGFYDGYFDGYYGGYYGGYAADYVATPASDGYWYYCADSKSYYPYVRGCASRWERVSPTPPPNSGG